jgi:hypothetical protein
MILLSIEKKKLHISTGHVEKCSDFITITNQFHMFSHCNAERTL